MGWGNKDDIPTITSSAATSTNYYVNPAGNLQYTGLGWQQQLGGMYRVDPFAQQKEDAIQKALAHLANKEVRAAMAETTTGRRVVQVFIADPDLNFPVEDSLLYQGKVIFTELTDQELFFDVDIKPILEAHNTKRKATLDKKATAKSGRDVYLEPVRIRDLKMVVVALANF